MFLIRPESIPLPYRVDNFRETGDEVPLSLLLIESLLVPSSFSFGSFPPQATEVSGIATSFRHTK